MISPTRDSRHKARDIIGSKLFFEVWCRCPLSCCEKRDSKNLYQRARSGQLKDFTGLTSVYENPLNPQLIIDTDRFSPAESLRILFHALQNSGLLRL